MSQVVAHLNLVPLAGIMLVVAAGFLLGRLSWRGMSLGPAGGTLIVAILAGRWGLDLHALYGTDDPVITLGGFGFALFIYSVGFDAGPRFLAGVRGGLGWRFAVIGLVVNLLAISVVLSGANLVRGRVYGLLLESSWNIRKPATKNIPTGSPLARGGL